MLFACGERLGYNLEPHPLSQDQSAGTDQPEWTLHSAGSQRPLLARCPPLVSGYGEGQGRLWEDSGGQSDH